jgi:hypothetical protein
MTEIPSTDTGEAHRVWTKPIPGDILVGEYSDGDYLIYNESEEPWHSLVLEPHQMEALLDFSDRVETAKVASLGEDIVNIELTVRYHDGAYIFHHAEVDYNPRLSVKQVEAIRSLLDDMQVIMEGYHELMEMKKNDDSLWFRNCSSNRSRPNR